jgi:hypothetical protein
MQLMDDYARRRWMCYLKTMGSTGGRTSSFATKPKINYLEQL